MNRYLINLSYIGTPFRGLQRQISVKEGSGLIDPTTIQGQVEMGLKTLRSVNEPNVIVSSRTDAGVHAFHSTIHVDLERQNGKKYDPNIITRLLNKRFAINDVPIRILKTYCVPNTFHCRGSAKSRTYMYKIAVVRDDHVNNSTLLQYIPITELNRRLFISTNIFDVDKVRETTQLFLGKHDFRSFMHKGTKSLNKITRKTIEKLEINEETPMNMGLNVWPSCVACCSSDYKCYNIVIKANGFLHKQVRRTVATLIAVAKGIVSPRDIKFMLQVPSSQSWDPRIKTVPPFGLYLCEVTYGASDVETFEGAPED